MTMYMALLPRDDVNRQIFLKKRTISSESLEYDHQYDNSVNTNEHTNDNNTYNSPEYQQEYTSEATDCEQCDARC